MSGHKKDKKVHHDLVIVGIVAGILIVIGFIWQVTVLINIRNGGAGQNQSTGGNTVASENSGGNSGGVGSSAGSSAGGGNFPQNSVGCTQNCLTLADNGKSLTLGLMSNVTISLPMADYDRSSLVITENPSDMLGEVFGAEAPAAGEWTRTFQAAEAGTATIMVPGNSSADPTFEIQITAQ